MALDSARPAGRAFSLTACRRRVQYGKVLPRRRGGRMARFGLTLIACLLFGPQTFACSVPVFRYALERWQPAKYELVVYHRGPLSRADTEAVRRFEAAAVRANVRITDGDLDGRLGG